MFNTIRKAKKHLSIQKQRLRNRNIYRTPHDNLDWHLHVTEAAHWLKRAQDAGEDKGVSYGAHFKGGFLPSYPETTGYIIPTFLQLADLFSQEDYLPRAIAMGNWEIEIQLDSGAVMGGRVDAQPSPAVFNTGMVMLGWLALYEKTREMRFFQASEQAANWLISIQEADGSWLKGNSFFADSRSTVYNVRAAWALAWHGLTSGEKDYVTAAIANGEYALRNQHDDGWFANCCLTDSGRPLLHTLAYAMRGLLELGLITGYNEFIQAAQRTAEALIQNLDHHGFLPGLFFPSFKPAAPWCCLTGSAQTSIVWSKLYLHTGDSRFLDAVQSANHYLMARHDISSQNPVVRGGIPGSWPVWGDYGRFMILNWATKFFIDALLYEQQVREG